MKDHRPPNTYAASRRSVESFLEKLPKTFVELIERADLMEFQRVLRRADQSDRTPVCVAGV
jgi:hypothetical protein